MCPIPCTPGLAPRYINRRSCTRRHRAQRGVVLIVALVVLVAMSLGGIAIMRSVDTSTLIAGNIAFKNRTRQSADVGIEAAIAWITANKSALINDNPTAGYYSSLSATNPFYWYLASSWTNAGKVNNGNPDASGNIVEYVIHRLCDLPSKAAADEGQLCASNEGTGGTTYEAPAEGSSSAGGAAAFTTPSKMYLRIIVRSMGPRNSTSYLQAMVLIS